MPRRDGTGPMGVGSMTGRGLGLCTGARTAKVDAGLGIGLGLGLACRRAFARGGGTGFASDEISSARKKGLLLEQRDALKDRMEAIDRQLESL